MPIHDSGPCILRGDMDPYWKKFLEPKERPVIASAFRQNQDGSEMLDDS
jgi:hypothetical protein